jgi:hypothetical protein
VQSWYLHELSGINQDNHRFPDTESNLTRPDYKWEALPLEPTFWAAICIATFQETALTTDYYMDEMKVEWEV